jgi:dipeptidase D
MNTKTLTVTNVQNSTQIVKFGKHSRAHFRRKKVNAIFVAHNIPCYMNEELNQLKPGRVWYYFGEILKIPRPSKKEEKILAYLKDFARKHDLEIIEDTTGNLVIRKPAFEGCENAPYVCLQGHVDMVGEKDPDVDHDFEKDPIETYIDNGWLKAKGTTLGADNGIALAAMLALLEAKDIEHGPLECLFTVDEESGLTGAFGLEPGMLKSHILLNMDSEDDGEFFIGCAGGKDTVIEMEVKKEQAPRGFKAIRIKVSGLQGGHSGDDIYKNRGNAIKALNRFLWEASKNWGIRVASLEGGNLRNAIARDAEAVFFIPEDQMHSLIEYKETFLEDIRFEFRVTEPDLNIEVEEIAEQDPVFTKEFQDQLLNALYACPHGVIEWSQDVPNFVETSTNLASVKMQDNNILRIATSQRSSIESAKEDVCNMVASVFNLTNSEIRHSDGYPGWSPNPDSRILAMCVESWKSLYGEEPVVRAVHAGLECGIIGDKYPGMDMISYGPTMRGVHSPTERLEIKTVEKFWDFTLDLLKRVAEEK